MIRIAPSILNANFDKLPEEIAKVAPGSDFIHLDIMDNIFVPNKTFDFDRSREIVTESVLPIDLHLMVDNADYWGPQYCTLVDDGVFSVTIHLEAVKNVRATLLKMKEFGVRRGLAIKPGTDLEEIYPFLNEVEMILIMTVEPGFGGQKFMGEMMGKVERARQWLIDENLSDLWLQVDGGISAESICVAASAGADTFVAGSAVYRSDDPLTKVAELREIAMSCYLQKG
jgi:ribulose-phosphate 3-epimerase